MKSAQMGMKKNKNKTEEVTMRAISHLHGQEGILALRRQLLKVERENKLWHKETMDDPLGF